MNIFGVFLLVVYATCVLSGPVPFPYPHNYYQPNPFIEKGGYDYPIFQSSNAHGIYYAQHPPHHPPPPQQEPHPFIYPYGQQQPQPQNPYRQQQPQPQHHFSQQQPGHPYSQNQPQHPYSQHQPQPRPEFQVPQQYPIMSFSPYGHGQNQNPQANQIIPGGDRIQDFTQFNFHQENPAAINGILSQFVNGLRDPSQLGPGGYPQQPSFTNVQITSSNAGNNGNDLVKQVTALVYNTESGTVKEIPALVFAGSDESSQLGVVSLIASPSDPTPILPANADETSFRPIANPNSGENVSSRPVSQEDSNSAVTENIPVQESSNDNGEMSDSNTNDEMVQEEIKKKYPVTILTPDAGIASTTGNTNNGDSTNISTSEKVNSSETEFNTESPETSTVIPLDSGASSDNNEQSVGDKISGTIASTTGPPPEWDVLSENLTKGEGDTTVSAVEPPSPK